MRSCGDSLGSDGVKSWVVAVGSLTIHTILACFSITVLVVAKETQLLDSPRNWHLLCLALKEYFGSLDIIIIREIFGITLAISLLGILASVSLVVGLKLAKPNYILVYLSYEVKAGIVLLLGILFALIKFHWYSAIVLFILTVFVIYSWCVIRRTYNKMAVLEYNCVTSDIRELLEDSDLQE